MFDALELEQPPDSFQEDAILHEFSAFSDISGEFDRGGWQYILTIFQAQSLLELLLKVCTKNNSCMEEARSIKCIMQDITEVKNCLTAVAAKSTIQRIAVCLSLEDSDWEKVPSMVELLRKINDSDEFIALLREEKLDGPDGGANFDDRHVLLTSQLQHEEYNEEVLGHLQVAYNFLQPLLVPSISLKTLIEHIKMNCDVPGSGSELMTVRDNMQVIHQWFTMMEVSIPMDRAWSFFGHSSRTDNLATLCMLIQLQKQF